MKSVSYMVFLLSMMTFSTVNAIENLSCGTKHQWHHQNESGWFFEFDFRENMAVVNKHESSQVMRRYDYKVQIDSNLFMTLESSYGDKIQLFPTSNRDFSRFVGFYTNGEEKQEMELICFQTKKLFSINFSQTDFTHVENLGVSNYLKNYFEISDLSKIEDQIFFVNKNIADIPFSLLSNVLQTSISNIGDWEDTFLNPEQYAKVVSGKGLSKDDKKSFYKLKDIIEKDLKKNPKLKMMGLLFGRDWYYGSGKIAFVLNEGSYLMIVPFSFDNDAHFGDERLDYQY